MRELVYGSERYRGRLDYLLDRRLSRGIDSLPGDALIVLRIGAYQLLYMDGVPEYAAVSQSVDQAKRAHGAGVGRLVNAVLRGVQRDGAGIGAFPDREAQPAEFLATWGSHPRWMIDRWLARWEFEEVERLVEANNQRSTMTVRPFRMERSELRNRMEAAGIGVTEVGFGSACLEVSGAAPEGILAAGPVVVQDPASAAVADYVDPTPDDRVADLCAAPGGKSLVLAESARYVVASDPSERRLRLVEENVRRLEGQTGNAVPVGLVRGDARCPPVADADVVLLDVPCTGTGTWRRHPDARWQLTPERLAEMVALQAAILDGAARAVRSGGLLVYSTCSLEPEENRTQVEAFLERNAGFSLEPGSADPRLSKEGVLDVRPQVMEYDGAFAARMRRA